MAKKIRGVEFEENLKNAPGLEFYDLSHPFGVQKPNARDAIPVVGGNLSDFVGTCRAAL